MKISVYTSFDDDPSTVAPTFGKFINNYENMD